MHKPVTANKNISLDFLFEQGRQAIAQQNSAMERERRVDAYTDLRRRYNIISVTESSKSHNCTAECVVPPYGVVDKETGLFLCLISGHVHDCEKAAKHLMVVSNDTEMVCLMSGRVVGKVMSSRVIKKSHDMGNNDHYKVYGADPFKRGDIMEEYDNDNEERYIDDLSGEEGIMHAHDFEDAMLSDADYAYMQQVTVDQNNKTQIAPKKTCAKNTSDALRMIRQNANSEAQNHHGREVPDSVRQCLASLKKVVQVGEIVTVERKRERDEEIQMRKMMKIQAHKNASNNNCVRFSYSSPPSSSSPISSANLGIYDNNGGGGVGGVNNVSMDLSNPDGIGNDCGDDDDNETLNARHAKKPVRRNTDVEMKKHARFISNVLFSIKSQNGAIVKMLQSAEIKKTKNSRVHKQNIERARAAGNESIDIVYDASTMSPSVKYTHAYKLTMDNHTSLGAKIGTAWVILQDYMPKPTKESQTKSERMMQFFLGMIHWMRIGFKAGAINVIRKEEWLEHLPPFIFLAEQMAGNVNKSLSLGIKAIEYAMNSVSKREDLVEAFIKLLYPPEPDIALPNNSRMSEAVKLNSHR
jgi:hypothetical protein